MAILVFKNDTAGMSQAATVPKPKKLWIDGARLIVLTEEDIPNEGLRPQELEINKYQLLQGALLTGGQSRRQAVKDYIRTMVGVDAKDVVNQMPPSGTPTQQDFWGAAAVFRRSDAKVNQLRTACGMTNQEMDSVFLAGNAVGQ